MTLSVVIHGAGRMATAHAAALARRRDIRVIAISNRGRKRGEPLAARLGVPLFATLREAIVATRPDIVVVATAPVDHADALECVRLHDVSVLCEKPVVASAEQFERLVDAFVASSRKFWVNFPLRLNARVAGIRAEIAAMGANLRQVTITSHYPRPHSYYEHGASDPQVMFGGVIWTQAIHEIDLAVHLIGEFRVSESLFGHAHHGLAVEDEASYRGLSAAGVAVSGIASTAPDLPFCSQVVFEGAAAACGFRRCHARFRFLPKGRTFDRLVHLYDQYTGRVTPLSTVWNECVDSYTSGRLSVLDGASTLATHRTVEAVYRTARALHPAQSPR